MYLAGAGAIKPLRPEITSPFLGGAAQLDERLGMYGMHLIGFALLQRIAGAAGSVDRHAIVEVHIGLFFFRCHILFRLTCLT